MKKLIYATNKSLQKLKAFEVSRILKMEKRQKEFFKHIEEEHSINDWLTEKEVIERFKISRSTLYRYRQYESLKYHKSYYNGKIRYKRKEVESFLIKKGKSW